MNIYSTFVLRYAYISWPINIINFNVIHRYKSMRQNCIRNCFGISFIFCLIMSPYDPKVQNAWTIEIYFNYYGDKYIHFLNATSRFSIQKIINELIWKWNESRMSTKQYGDTTKTKKKMVEHHCMNKIKITPCWICTIQSHICYRSLDFFVNNLRRQYTQRYYSYKQTVKVHYQHCYSKKNIYICYSTIFYSFTAETKLNAYLQFIYYYYSRFAQFAIQNRNRTVPIENY